MKNEKNENDTTKKAFRAYCETVGMIQELFNRFCNNCPYATVTKSGKFRCKKCTGCKFQLLGMTLNDIKEWDEKED